MGCRGLCSFEVEVACRSSLLRWMSIDKIKQIFDERSVQGKGNKKTTDAISPATHWFTTVKRVVNFD